MESTIRQVIGERLAGLRVGGGLPLRALKAASAIASCRTAELGGHVQKCPEGHVERVWYNSCRHRCCPICTFLARERWVRRQLARLPACDYFHVVFTIPCELNALWAYNRRVMTTLLFRCAWESARQMLADEKHLGALPGALAAFHSWGQTLWQHPHVHMLLSAGGLDEHGVWRPTRPGWLLPGRALSAKFRGKLRAWLIRAIERDDSCSRPSGASTSGSIS